MGHSECHGGLPGARYRRRRGQMARSRARAARALSAMGQVLPALVVRTSDGLVGADRLSRQDAVDVALLPAPRRADWKGRLHWDGASCGLRPDLDRRRLVRGRRCLVVRPDSRGWATGHRPGHRGSRMLCGDEVGAAGRDGDGGRRAPRRPFTLAQRGANPGGRDLGGLTRAARLDPQPGDRSAACARAAPPRCDCDDVRRTGPRHSGLTYGRSRAGDRHPDAHRPCRARVPLPGNSADRWRVICPSHYDRGGCPQVAPRWPGPPWDVRGAWRVLCEELDGGPTPLAQPPHGRTASSDALRRAVVPRARREARAAR